MDYGLGPAMTFYQAKMIIHAFDTNIKSNPNFVIFISSDETDMLPRIG